MLELTIYGIGFFLCTLLIQYMLFKVRKNHNHGPNGVWVGSRAILVLCVVGIMNHKVGYLAAILGFICADEMGKAAGLHQNITKKDERLKSKALVYFDCAEPSARMLRASLAEDESRLSQVKFDNTSVR